MTLGPRAAWLAIGAILAALLVQEGALAAMMPRWGPLVVGGALLVSMAVALRRGHAATAVLLIGVALVSLRIGLGMLAAPVEQHPALPTGGGPWRATVADVSSPAGDQQRAMLSLGVPDATAGGRLGTPDARWLVYAWLPRHPMLLPGDELTVLGRPEPPPTDAQGFAGFLASRGAVGTLKAERMERLAGGEGPMAAVQQLRGSIDGWLARALPEPEAGLAAGILVGLRERVSRGVNEDFTTTGLSHVVAISGWNIALVAGIVMGLLRATGLSRRPRSVLAIGAICGYTVVAGAEASVVRAAVMGTVVLVAREGGRPTGAATALAVACAGLLVVDPGMVTNIGLQLSLAATAGLLALGGAAEAAVRRLAPPRTPAWLIEALAVSLAAQLATLPLILLHFGRLSLISPLANVLMAPLVPLAMLGAAVGALSGPLLGLPLLDLLLVPLRLAAWLPLTGMVRGASLLASVPHASVALDPQAGSLGVVASLLALVVALRRARSRTGGAAGPAHAAGTLPERRADHESGGRRRRHRRLALIGGTACLLGVFVAALVPEPAGRLRISVLDVGQGDAILVESSDGPRMLVDGGSDPDLLVRRLDERIPMWDRRLDLVVLTHPHEDHAGGLAGLMPRYRVAAVLETGLESDGAGVRELRAAAARSGARHLRVAQGDALALGPARVDVVWPPRSLVANGGLSTNREVNATSIVLAIRLGQQRALLMGDLEEDRDRQLVEALGGPDGPWDLLKVAHHGSATATSETLLEAIQPRLAAISVGADNDYGHPAPELLERLRQSGALTLRTDAQGTLSITLDGRTGSGEGRG